MVMSVSLTDTPVQLPSACECGCLTGKLVTAAGQKYAAPKRSAQIAASSASPLAPQRFGLLPRSARSSVRRNILSFAIPTACGQRLSDRICSLEPITCATGAACTKLSATSSMVLLMSRQLTATGLRLSTTELKLQPATKETPMPTVSDFFPSKYLSAADLKGTTLHATID
jgi:hypothetical protein